MDYLVARELPDATPHRYPTREEILALPRPMFKWGVLRVITEWKKADYVGWKHKDESAKYDALERLTFALSKVYGVQPPILSQWEDGYDSYNPATQVITTTSNSILSLLHELGHHLFGPSELHACRFSVWLYQLRFTSAMEQLVWSDIPGQEHLLVRR